MEQQLTELTVAVAPRAAGLSCVAAMSGYGLGGGFALQFELSRSGAHTGHGYDGTAGARALPALVHELMFSGEGRQAFGPHE